MVDILLIPVAIVYLLTVAALFVYGINFFYLTYLALKQPNEPLVSHLELATSGVLPYVTVQLPIYNELYVAERLIHAAAALQYPAGRLEIQVLDDSTDETRLIIANLVQTYQRHGIKITHVRREGRGGYKAGALAYGLALAEGELIAIFDADFVPHADFLLKAVHKFSGSPRLAFVQARWTHLNRDHSLLTFLQALAVDAHFVVEQYARWAAGYWFNFNGTAGVWRKAALLDAGGWRSETLTEDLDISYRAFLRGWQAAYIRDVSVPAELPVSFSAYRRQQHRWARGSLECALLYLPIIWGAQIPLRIKLQSTLHLTGYAVHLLLFALAVLYPLVLFISQTYTHLLTLYGLALFFSITTFAPTLFFIAAQKQLGFSLLKRLPAILFTSVFGAGMMLNTVRAAVQILLNRPAVFERTPKYGSLERRWDWIHRSYQIRLEPLLFLELGFAGLNAFTVLLALRLQNWAIAFYAGIFLAGLLFNSGLSLVQSFASQSKKVISS